MTTTPDSPDEPGEDARVRAPTPPREEPRRDLCVWCHERLGDHDTERHIACWRAERDWLERAVRESVDALSPFLQSGGLYAHLMSPGESITRVGPARLVAHLEAKWKTEAAERLKHMTKWQDDRKELMPLVPGYVYKNRVDDPEWAIACAALRASLTGGAAPPHEEM